MTRKELWKSEKLSTKDEAIVLEQYKLYMEMADRISERRDKANGFFLTLNTAVISAIGIFLDKFGSFRPIWIVLLPTAALVLLCGFWFRLVKSYRQLNSQKFILIGEVEEKLPVRLWSTEWKRLGEGKAASKYVPLSEIEENIPVVFGVLYVVAAALVIWVGINV
jgi:hypothetical protein